MTSFSQGDSLIKIYKTFSPNGIQSLLLSPLGRDQILGYKPVKNGTYLQPLTTTLSQTLNENIEFGNISAITTSPLFFYYDVNQAKTVNDIQKLCQCRKPEFDTSPDAVPYLWAVILFSIIIVLGWFFYMTYAKNL